MREELPNDHTPRDAEGWQEMRADYSNRAQTEGRIVCKSCGHGMLGTHEIDYRHSICGRGLQFCDCPDDMQKVEVPLAGYIEEIKRLQTLNDELVKLVKEFKREAELVKEYTSDGSVYLHPNDFKPLTTSLITRADDLISKAERGGK